MRPYCNDTEESAEVRKRLVQEAQRPVELLMGG